MRYVVGIGNPGEQYRGTRHNVGFDIVEALADRLGVALGPDEGPVLAARGGPEDDPWVLLLPQSYVNLSGEAFAAFVREPVSPEQVLVVLDDLALDPGVLRLRAGGSDGGHRGMRSMIEHLGTRDIPRLRVGVGRAPAEDWREFVLAPFSGEDRITIDRAIARSVDAIAGWLEHEPFQRLQGRVNTASPSGTTRGTGDPVSAASAAPEPLSAGRNRDVRVSFMEPKTVKYEGMFLLPAQGPTLDRGAVLQTVGALLEKHTIRPTEIDVWDERKLAYPVKKHKRGIYVLAFFETDPEALVPLNRDLNLAEDILRHVFVRHDDEHPEFPRRKPRRDEEGPATEKAADKPAEKAADKPAEKPAEKAADKPAEKPAEEAADKPAEADEGAKEADETKDGDQA